jgi:hypothetical protein
MTTTDIRGGQSGEDKQAFIQREMERLRVGGAEVLLEEIRRTGVAVEPDEPTPTLRRKVAETLYALQDLDGPDEETAAAIGAASGLQGALFAGTAFASLDSGAMSIVEGVEIYQGGIRIIVDPNLVRSDSARFIISNILPFAVARWLAKNADYGNHHRDSKYGLKGELIGLDRKMGKLYNAIWLEQDMAGESAQEMLDDTFGTILIMLDLLAKEYWDQP